MEQIIKINSAEAFRKYTDIDTFSKIKNYNSVSEMWKHCTKEYKNLSAVQDDKNVVSFAELENMASRIRYAIGKSFTKNNVRIAIVAENSIAFIAKFLAITTSGNAALILPPSLNEQAIMGCCKKYNAELLSTIDIDKLPNETAAIKDCDGKSECVLMFTSGTTGQSKAAILNNSAVMQGTVNGCYGYKDVFNQKYLLVLPLFHVFGLIRNLMTSLYTGSCLFICQNQQEMFKDIEKFKPTMLVSVPAVVEIGLKLSKLYKRNMFGENMKTIIAGAAAVSPYLVKECAKYNINLCPGYGLTESANLISGNPESKVKPESVGLPFPNQEFKIVDGELWFRGRNRMDGYADKDAENPFEGEWLKTGDLVRFDEDGFLYITGRCKEIIVLTNGENISPAEIEKEFNRLDYVQDSQVYEDINEFSEHILVLEVVPRGEKSDLLKKQLEDINNSLPSDRRMSKIIIRDSDFERSPSMKIIRYKKVK